ncbi:Rne/Rng family ribonuclease [Candidatus Dependentiae bacterium]|nr:Rne/Rng family ribonuclease [Candidatus Dependentiae bacterium]
MKKILINKNFWQTRVAILDQNKLRDVYFDTHTKEDLERCFFKGKVSKVLPGIQTAFVDIGQKKAGFLHISEIDRALATEKTAEFLQVDDTQEQEFLDRKIKSAISIEKILTPGSEILVQVIKEPVYEKGAKLTTCYTLPGKFLVLMPNIPQIGISKKIENKEERMRLREILVKSLPPKMGVIIRTTAEDRKAKDLKRELAFLINIWKSILKKFKKSKCGDKIHEDLPITLRAVRDHLDDDVEAVITDSKEDQKAIYKFVKNFTPEHANKIKFYNSPPPLFDKFDVEKQINKALEKKVPLRSGGSLIIEVTEAMTVVDVNTGKFIGKDNPEETILKTNLEAAEEIVDQLRLRNIGGLIVIDFIDMASHVNRQKLSRNLEKALKERDKFQSVTLKISEFGLVQMTRKRSGKTLIQQLTNTCPTCNANGFIKSDSTISFELLNNVKNEIVRQNIHGNIILTVPERVFEYLVHNEYQSLLKLEKKLQIKIILEGDRKLKETQFNIEKAK